MTIQHCNRMSHSLDRKICYVLCVLWESYTFFFAKRKIYVFICVVLYKEGGRVTKEDKNSHFE